ncbi:hypothetical protein JCM5353_008953 [Sporobolomyces roseus]
MSGIYIDTGPRHDHTALRNSLSISPSWRDPLLPILIEKLPPLPQIKNDQLAVQAVSHRSHFATLDSRNRNETKREAEVQSYEVLELIGDGFMGAAAASALRKHFPQLPTYQCREVLAVLVANNTISYLAVGYGLHRKLRMFKDGATDRGISQKVCADLFEAHIGALFVDEEDSERSERLSNWLNRLFSPEVFPSLSQYVDGWMAKVAAGDVKPSRGKRRAEQQITRDTIDCNNCGEAELGRITYECDQPKAHGEWHAFVVVDHKRAECGRRQTKKAAIEAAVVNNLVKHVKT